MNKKSVLMTVVVFVFCSVVYGQPWDGNGVEGDPYQIWEANDMQAIGANPVYWDAHFLLCADIDLGAYTGTSYNIIGSGLPFTGVFDGNNHTISNLTYDSTGTNCIGLFGQIKDPNAEVKDLGLINPDVNAGTAAGVGSLVGSFWAGTISGCYVEGGSVTGGHSVGGLVGDTMIYGYISNSYYEGNVTGYNLIGGLVGYNNSQISECHSTGNVTGENNEIGGLVGHNARDGYISSSHSEGNVTGEDWVGGLVGWNDEGYISNCYSTGDVTAWDYVGGLVGWNEYGDIERCFSEGGISGRYSVGGLVGYAGGGNIQGSYSLGSATGEFEIGGLAGANHGGGNIQDCYSMCSVSGVMEIGGLVGCHDGHITNCYSTGSVTGESYVGGMVGYGNPDDAVASYWDVNTSGQIYSDEGEGKTTEQMHDVATFAAWACSEEWTIDDGNDYPRLAWEGAAGEPIVVETFFEGAGEPNEPYLIETAAQLNMVGLLQCKLDRHFKMAADIDLSEYTGESFNIIGYCLDYSDNSSFIGVFDGNGHTISNFTYDSSGLNYIGLFGWIDDPNAEVKNLGLIDPNISVEDGGVIGAMAGVLERGTISNCYVKGGSIRADLYVGGLAGMVGFQGIGHMKNCYSTAEVKADHTVGGLVGFNWDGSVSDCYSEGRVDGNDVAGGLVGSSSAGEITNCYSIGKVTGQDDVGGLVGSEAITIFTSCFWDSDVNPDVNGIGDGSDPNVIGLPTVEMQTESTYTDAGWDFVGETVNGPNDIWKMNCEGMSYPKLSWWEPALGDFICTDGVNMLDFAILGDAWFSDPNMANWEAGCDISEPEDEVIDWLDLAVFVGNWLFN
jgi:hypothetical protein